MHFCKKKNPGEVEACVKKWCELSGGNFPFSISFEENWVLPKAPG
jgi:hypothetical protein